MLKILPQNVADDIQEVLADMQEEVTLLFFTDETSYTTKETQQLLEDLASLNSKIKLITKNIKDNPPEAKQYEVVRVPGIIVLDKNGQYHGVKFSGIPAGHEINSLLSALLNTSGNVRPLSPDLAERVKKIDKPVTIQVFVTLTCPHCPGAVENAHRLAMENPNIKAEMVEAQTFPDLSRQNHVSSVPKIVFSNGKELLGDVPLENFIASIETRD